MNNTEDISHRDSNITAWHDINDAPLSDYNHPYIQALAFQTLCPSGDGDATNRDRRKYISMTDSNKHLLKYHIKDNLLNLLKYPFAKHNRWYYWAQNIAERHRINSQRQFYLKKKHQLMQI